VLIEEVLIEKSSHPRRRSSSFHLPARIILEINMLALISIFVRGAGDKEILTAYSIVRGGVVCKEIEGVKAVDSEVDGFVSFGFLPKSSSVR
jgi:hypothetical protein